MVRLYERRSEWKSQSFVQAIRKELVIELRLRFFSLLNVEKSAAL